MHVALDVLHDDDRVVDDHADGQHQPNSVSRLIEKPSASMPVNVVISADADGATLQMTVARKLCRKR